MSFYSKFSSPRSLRFAVALLAGAGSLVAETILFSPVVAEEHKAQVKEAAKKEEWIPLFNGKNLDGWTVKIRGHAAGENPGETFRVENGAIKVAYDKYENFNGKFGHMFYKDKFSHYRLRIEYRFTGEQVAGGPGWAVLNSGVMLHGESPESMGKDQDFPASIEVQFLGGSGSGVRPTANLCTPGTHVVMGGELIKRHCTSSKSKTYHGDQWVTAEIEVHGNKAIKHWVDGEVVLEYEQAQLDDSDAHSRELGKKLGTMQLSEGTISLQSESHPVEFRKVELLKLAE